MMGPTINWGRRNGFGLVLTLLFLGLAPAALASSQVDLVLSQSTAFKILGYDCGGIKEQSFPTGFDLHGYPTGVVDLETTCSTGGRGSPPHTYTGSAKVVWNFAGAVRSYVSPATSIGPNSPSSDAHGDQLSTAGSYAVVSVVAPDAPTIATAAQSGDQVDVTWTPSPSPPWVVSSTVTATPQGASAPVLMRTVGGSKTNELVGPLQPSTTYLITVVSTNPGGSSPSSGALTFTSQPATVPPSAPTAVSASWAAPGTGASDSLLASWAAAYPGNSPVTAYQVTIRIYDGDTTGSFSQIVRGSARTATFAGADDIYDWSVQVRAHNAAGWGPWSTQFILGGT
jgi:hypothetical protein